METKGLRTWIEIDTKAIENNYRAFRSIISKNTKLMAIVKSNAYGHGLLDFSRTISDLGADWLGVDSITEALKLRKNGVVTPILVLGYVLPELIPVAIKNNISITVSNFETLKIIKNSTGSEQLKVHIKVDTGMHRQGFLLSEQKKLMPKIKDLKGKIFVEGLYTHFAAAKNPNFPDHTMKQIEEFKKWKEILKKAGFNPISHAAATSGTIVYPESHFDMVRVGISLHGLWPSQDVKKFAEKKMKIFPTFTWKVVISEIKKLPKGSRVGYDLTEELKRNSRIALCPIGYWHGYPRSMSGKGFVIVGGKKVKVLGRISMGMTVIDITDVPKARVGDEVILIGSSGKERISVEDFANQAGTINYEVVTRINPLIKKFYK